MNKFVTDIYHHEKHKKFWVPRPAKPPAQLRQFKPFKPWQPRKPPIHSMVDPDWLQQHIDRNGPYLYHGTTEGAAQKIAQEGLYPFNELEAGQGESQARINCPNCGESYPATDDQTCPFCHYKLEEWDDPRHYIQQDAGSSNYSDFYHPRNGHAYLGTEDYIRSQGHIKGGVVGIDLRKLDPNQMNPDEDHFQPGSHTYNSQHPVIQAMEEGGDMAPDPEYHRGYGGDNLGEWAQNAQLGSGPGETEYSMGRGSMAYNGHIPPDAIHMVGTGKYDPTRYNNPVGNEWLEQGNWVPGQNPETGEPQQALSAIQKAAAWDKSTPELTPVEAAYVDANILDPISPTLDASVFLHPEAPMPQIRPEISKWIHQTIYAALERNGYEGPQRWLNLVLTGSLTTYQYSELSDCDVSLFINSKVFPEWSRAEMIGIMVKEFDGVLVPGTHHDIQAFVVSSKLTPKDLYRPGLRSALDLDSGKWIVPPEHDRTHDVEKEYKVSHTYALECMDKMDRLLRFEPDKAVMYYRILHKRRAKDEAAGKGDFSDSNIAYKMLAQKGYLNRLHELGVKTF